MPTNTKEIGFEEFIEEYLIDKKNKYIKRTDSQYDKDLAMDKGLLFEFVQKTQVDKWKQLTKRHGDKTEGKFLTELDRLIAKYGLLEVLRSGLKESGTKFDLAYFKPETGFNQEAQELYQSNIFSVMRQVRYSKKNENSIDMVLFLNGMPIFTIELKNQLTGQSVRNGINQYRTDRDPKEKLLSFKRCLVHFAVDTEQAYMATKLAGLKTFFLPFNKGDNNSAGNPVNPKGYKTSYVWEEVWSTDSVLELVREFIHLEVIEKEDERGHKYKQENLIFPRYHQRDTVKRIIEHSFEHGSGQNYLIEHSAGSGKSMTIAWTAYRLASLHDNKDEKVFDSVIVVTDRRILDKQLRDTIMQFEQTPGVVKAITESSNELKEALEQGEKIIITTLQKFPVIVDATEKIAGKKFAVIIDEAHSSQSGESSKGLKKVLSKAGGGSDEEVLESAAKEQGTVKDNTYEDMILKEMKARKSRHPHISFFAFTATPKQKTLELFGTKNPVDSKYYPFSLYSMKQAIEERFIIDVLKNYTTFQVYFSLLKKVREDSEYKKKQVQSMLINYIEKHEHAIGKKVDTIVKHFNERISTLVGGKSKAMIVTKSRLHAVRYKLTIDKYMKNHGYPYKAIVAFSGTVKDVKEFTEGNMNGFPEAQTAEQFKKDQYKFLIVAEKFQTGFDQPLLTAMYVDKKLMGVNAVQTLSRLNRTHRDKEEVFVLDFVNEVDQIKESFQPYYTTTILSEATDPNVLHDLQRDIYGLKLFSEQEVSSFVEQYFRGIKPAMINSMLDIIVERFKEYLPEEQEDARTNITDYVSKYAFISQIIDFEDTSLEELYVYLRLLRKKLPVVINVLPIEVLDNIDMESYKIIKTRESKIELDDEGIELYPLQNGGHSQVEDEIDLLSKIIKEVNDKFGTDFSEDDRVILGNLSEKLLNNKELEGSIKNNTRDSAKIKFDEVFQSELIKLLNGHFDFYKKIDSSSDRKEFVKTRIFDLIHSKMLRK